MATVEPLRPFASEDVDNAAADELYAAPASPTTLKDRGIVRFTNVSAVAVTVNCWVVPAAGTEGDDNAVLKGYSVAANSYHDIAVEVPAGAKLSVQAGAATSITAHPLNWFRYQ